MKTAAALGIPATFNAASYFIDRHLPEGRGRKIAIECGDERVSYADLHERVNRFGSALRRNYGVAAGDRVALLLLDTPEFAYGFFGAVKIGAVPVPTNTLWKAPDYRYLLNDSAARVLVINEELLPEFSRIPRAELPFLEHVIVAGARTSSPEDSFAATLALGSPELTAEPCAHDQPAFWLYSSGSTGSPKGCVHLQHDMVICGELFGRGILGITESDRTFSVAKLFFAYGLGNALYFQLEIIDGIGSTEALHMFISNRAGAIRVGSSGRLVPGYEARILGDDGVTVAPGEMGNLWIAGESTCAGYWNQPEKTQDTFQDGWLRTGDKYSQDADGYFWYAGRSDDMLKVGGQWVSPVEVEHALMEHPAVRECGVVGREDGDELVKPAAFVVLRDTAAASGELAAELQRFVREKLADFKRPRWVEFIPELPKTP